MPYLECPGCRLRLYSAATRSWIADSCPVCGESLVGAVKWFPGQTGVRTLCREFQSTPQAVASARHALDDVGHWPQLEAPERAVEALLAGRR